MDDGDKIRRNLVTFCFYILISHWLSFSLIDIFTIKNLTSVEPRKYLIAVWLVYVYFLARYRWSDDYCSQFKIKEERYRKSVSEITRPLIKKEAARFSSLGINGNWRGIFDRFEDIRPTPGEVPDAIKQMREKGGQGELVIIMLPDQMEGDVSWSGYVPGYYTFSAHQKDKSIGENYQIAAMVGYSFPFWWVFWNWLKIGISSAIYSKNGLEAQVPVYIALFANGALLAQVIHLYD